eukprot:c14710_g1_i2.p1 GENE.c14710_g1_i2~~c14710_g1_i2.p1  ORF type:complete len:377 (+),score=109.57 c14710_g1_i2:84-1214(+)
MGLMSIDDVTGNSIIMKRFQIKRTISFGNYEGFDLETNQLVFIKTKTNAIEQENLRKESKIFTYLSKGTFTPGVPRVIFEGYEKNYSVLVTQLLQVDLEVLFSVSNLNFPLKVIFGLTNQMIRRVQHLHSRGLVHRNIQPCNFVIGSGNEQEVLFLVGMKNAKPFIDFETNKHILQNKANKPIGLPRYSSINAMKGSELSRKDDLEMLGYVLIYFLNGGNLPWMGQHANSRHEKCAKILKFKQEIGIEELCRGHPKQFSLFFQYIRSLKFEEDPNYNYLRSLFTDSSNVIIRNPKCNFSWLDQLKIVPQKKQNDGKHLLLCWSPLTHRYWPESFKNGVKLILLVENRLNKTNELPRLPHDIWICILAHLSDEWPHC